MHDAVRLIKLEECDAFRWVMGGGRVAGLSRLFGQRVLPCRVISIFPRHVEMFSSINFSRLALNEFDGMEVADKRLEF